MNNSITDEELRDELEKMGYTGISEELFVKFKRDLDKLIAEDRESSLCSSSSQSELAQSECQQTPLIDQNSSYLNDLIPGNKDSKSIPAKPMPTKYNSISSSNSRVIKRKTLRHKSNGKSYVEEVSFTSIFSDSNETSRGEYHQTSYSYQPLYDKKISRSTGNLFQISKKKLPTVLPMVAYGSKNCDPVSRYHQYRKYWESHKTPSEKKHNALRWNVREQMLDYDPIAEFSLKQMPNIFHIPRERRSNIYRWNSCSNLNNRFA